jgi:hypothetical protein
MELHHPSSLKKLFTYQENRGAYCVHILFMHDLFMGV